MKFTLRFDPARKPFVISGKQNDDVHIALNSLKQHIQNEANDSIESLAIDFRAVDEIDNLALLSTCALLGSYGSQIQKLSLSFLSEPNSSLIPYLVRSGILEALVGDHKSNIEIKLWENDGKTHQNFGFDEFLKRRWNNSNVDSGSFVLQALKIDLASFSGSVQEGKDHLRSKIKGFAQQILDLSSSYSIEEFNDLENRQVTFEIIQKFFYESVTNVLIHAYTKHEEQESVAVVFGILHFPKKHKLRPPFRVRSSSEPTVASDRPFFEFIVADAGDGLASNIASWIDVQNEEQIVSKQVLTKLRRSQEAFVQKKRPLSILSEIFFDNPISSTMRADVQGLSPYTGYMDLNHSLLKFTGSFSLFDGRESIVREFPSVVQNRGGANTMGRTVRGNDYGDLGTAVRLIFQPTDNFAQINLDGFLSIDTERDMLDGKLGTFRESIQSAYLEKSQFSIIPDSILAFDKRFIKDSHVRPLKDHEVRNSDMPSDQEKISSFWNAANENLDGRPIDLFLRLPNNADKRDFISWLTPLDDFGGEKENGNQVKFRLILLDITQFQAAAFARVLTNEFRLYRHNLNITSCIFVTEKFDIARFDLVEGNKFAPSENGLAEFFFRQEGNTSLDENLSIRLHLELLRKWDSDQFWKEALSPANETPYLVKGLVNWDYSASQKSQHSISAHSGKFENFLNLHHAITNDVIFRICRRALRRLAFVFDAVAVINSDDIIKEFADAVHRDITYSKTQPEHSTDSDVIILVSSVIISGKTRSIADKFAYKNMQRVQAIFFDRSKEYDSESSSVGIKSVSLLNWLKVENDTNSQFFRLRGTAEVSRYGDRSIRIPRYMPSADELTPLSIRSPQETIDELTENRALTIGHWESNSRHELFAFNFRLIGNIAYYSRSALFRYFESIVKIGETDGSTTVVLYPNHSTVMNFIRKFRSAPEMQASKNGSSALFLEVNFISTASRDPAIVSPMSRFLFIDLVRQIQKRKTGSSKIRFLVFDDATISGKTIRLLMQFVNENISEYNELADKSAPPLPSLSDSELRSFVILDRSGMPAFVNEGERFSKKHKRYWRLDVPDLGNKKSCAICNGLIRLDQVSTHYRQTLSSHKENATIDTSDEFLELVENLKRQWETKKSDGQIPANSDYLYLKRKKVTKYSFISPEEVGNDPTVTHNTAETLAVHAAEISRLTHLKSYALTLANKLLEEGEGPAAIFILSSQISLFHSNFNISEEVEHFSGLLDLLLSHEYQLIDKNRDYNQHIVPLSDPHISLGYLMLSSVDPVVLIEILEDVFKQLLRKSQSVVARGLKSERIDLYSTQTFTLIKAMVNESDKVSNRVMEFTKELLTSGVPPHGVNEAVYQLLFSLFPEWSSKNHYLTLFHSLKHLSSNIHSGETPYAVAVENANDPNATVTIDEMEQLRAAYGASLELWRRASNVAQKDFGEDFVDYNNRAEIDTRLFNFSENRFTEIEYPNMSLGKIDQEAAKTYVKKVTDALSGDGNSMYRAVKDLFPTANRFVSIFDLENTENELMGKSLSMAGRIYSQRWQEYSELKRYYEFKYAKLKNSYRVSLPNLAIPVIRDRIINMAAYSSKIENNSFFAKLHTDQTNTMQYLRITLENPFENKGAAKSINRTQLLFQLHGGRVKEFSHDGIFRVQIDLPVHNV